MVSLCSYSIQHGQELCVGLQASVVLLFLLLLLGGQSVAVAPGDEDGECPVPQYPVRVKVLMDSWRYHTLIAGVWTATTRDRSRMTPKTVTSKNNGSKVRSYTDTIHPYLQWYSQGTCAGGSASVCAGGYDKRLRTQFINKNLPESHTDPVRIYVNVTYSFTGCLGEQSHCDVELFLANQSNGESSSYGSGGIMPNNLIASSVSSGTKQFFFDSDTSVTGFLLALISVEACVTVSRVLVYRYECPGSDRLPPTSLLRHPATPAPVSGHIRPVKPYCAENAHLRDENSTISCKPNGEWLNSNAQCECNSGYREDEEGTTCEGPQSTLQKISILFPSEVEQLSISPFTTTTSAPSEVLFTPTLARETTESSSVNTNVVLFAGVGGALGATILLLLISIVFMIAIKHKHKNKRWVI